VRFLESGAADLSSRAVPLEPPDRPAGGWPFEEDRWIGRQLWIGDVLLEP
jgi:hypothetical protein